MTDNDEPGPSYLFGLLIAALSGGLVGFVCGASVACLSAVDRWAMWVAR